MITTKVAAIHELLQDGAIQVQVAGESKEEVLDNLLGLLSEHPKINDFEGARLAVLAREEVMSTGVGKGLALPHAKTAAVKGIVAAFAITEHPIEYNAIDGLPVKMLFLMISTEQAKSQHIKLLSRVSRLMNGDAFRNQLLQATSTEEVIQIFQEGELSIS